MKSDFYLNWCEWDDLLIFWFRKCQTMNESVFEQHSRTMLSLRRRWREGFIRKFRQQRKIRILNIKNWTNSKTFFAAKIVWTSHNHRNFTEVDWKSFVMTSISSTKQSGKYLLIADMCNHRAFLFLTLEEVSPLRISMSHAEHLKSTQIKVLLDHTALLFLSLWIIRSLFGFLLIPHSLHSHDITKSNSLQAITTNSISAEYLARFAESRHESLCKLSGSEWMSKYCATMAYKVPKGEHPWKNKLHMSTVLTFDSPQHFRRKCWAIKQKRREASGLC